MRILDIIAHKRDGLKLSKEEIDYFIQAYTQERIPDYQASALLMAIYLRGMDEEETFHLTNAMASSGEKMDLSQIDGIKIDKHSTGGVGDKTSLIVGPIVAACNIPVAKMSGRGLGHTGGTIDKLEAIPGFMTSLSPETFIQNVNSIKMALVGQTKNLAPADKKLYALRDVTGTVGNLSLIASSIMSKKLASGADAIVLDVKTGSGALMKNQDDAQKLAMTMVKIGNHAGKDMIALVTDMNQPLGNKVGNALEIQEVVETLKGQGPKDLRELSLALAANMIYLSHTFETYEECYSEAQEKLESGLAYEKFKEFVSGQGGDISYIDNPEKLHRPSFCREVYLEQEGFVYEMNTEEIGMSSLLLGGGRERKEDTIDMDAGIQILCKPGDFVAKDSPVAIVYTNNEEKFDNAITRLKNAYTIRAEKPVPNPLIQCRIYNDSVEKI